MTRFTNCAVLSVFTGLIALGFAAAANAEITGVQVGLSPPYGPGTYCTCFDGSTYLGDTAPGTGGNLNQCNAICQAAYKPKQVHTI
jgi:hypothetical protein